jgi:hypothetical protein
MIGEKAADLILGVTPPVVRGAAPADSESVAVA